MVLSLLQVNPEVIMDSAVHIVQHLSPQQRSDLMATIKTLESGGSVVPPETPASTSADEAS